KRTLFQLLWRLTVGLVIECGSGILRHKSCVLWSSAGLVVLRGSTFEVYCTFSCKSKKYIYSGNPPQKQSHRVFNDTTIYLKIDNLTSTTTFSCSCEDKLKLDPCGQDISTGYPPDSPKDIFCNYEIQKLESGVVNCSWDGGKDTFLWNHFVLRDRGKPPPPILGQPDCSSRKCEIKVEQSLNTSYLEIQYRADHQEWRTDPDSVGSSQVRSIASLEPYRLYHFRARSKFSFGLWSSWSSNVSSWTQEEGKQFALRSCIEPNTSISRGKITLYTVSSPCLNHTTNVSADSRNFSVPLCSHSEVTVWAHNSKGMSPPATMTPLYTDAEPVNRTFSFKKTENKTSVTISWRKPELTAAMYVVELYPEDFLLNEFRWVLLNKSETTAVFSGIKPYECYEGAVYVFYNKSFVGKTRSKRFAALESGVKPTSSPSFQEKVEGKNVIITWERLPRAFRMGCITQYTIYVEGNTGYSKNYSAEASKTTWVIENLPPDVYTLWMTASTGKGEGPKSPTGKFPIKRDNYLFLLFNHLSFRFWELFQCLMLDVVPDPANSKWAKECTKEKGRLSIQLLSSGSTSTDQEEDTNLVDVEELFKQTTDTSLPTTDSAQLISLSPDADLTTLMYPALTTYIKSLSHDSDTNTTVDYISSDGPGNMEDGEEEEAFEDMSFLPSHSIFLTEMLQFDGKLTLDAVKIDCSDLQTT
uniref:Fibronectin type-III domain-containing protein n=1 Tax=Oryzias latipes TaxID=8090 RepID=A0A3P9I9F4_ORYLA